LVHFIPSISKTRKRLTCPQILILPARFLCARCSMVWRDHRQHKIHPIDLKWLHSTMTIRTPLHWCANRPELTSGSYRLLPCLFQVIRNVIRQSAGPRGEWWSSMLSYVTATSLPPGLWLKHSATNCSSSRRRKPLHNCKSRNPGVSGLGIAASGPIVRTHRTETQRVFTSTQSSRDSNTK
jgi:hypothetical protein